MFHIFIIRAYHKHHSQSCDTFPNLFYPCTYLTDKPWTIHGSSYALTNRLEYLLLVPYCGYFCIQQRIVCGEATLCHTHKLNTEKKVFISLCVWVGNCVIACDSDIIHKENGRWVYGWGGLKLGESIHHGKCSDYEQHTVFPGNADDQMGASELRKRYHAGGSLPDDNLSASQLRARKGIKPNSKGSLCTKYNETLYEYIDEQCP